MPGQQTLGQSRVIDPILSNHARGFRRPGNVGHRLFPYVDVQVRGNKVIKFDREAFRKHSARRAPGSDTKRVQIGYGSEPIALVQDALEGLVPIENMEEANAVPGIDLGTRATNKVMDALEINLEYEQAQIAIDASNYVSANKIALSGTDQWTDSGSDLVGQFDDAKEAIRQKIGLEPNTLVLGPKPFRAAKNHSQVKEQFKYTSAQSITLEMLANFFELETVAVGRAVYIPEEAADDAGFTDVWGNNAILAYVPPENMQDIEVPSFGYTYRLRGHPAVETPYYERRNKSWVYPTTYDRRPYEVGMDAGYLFQTPAA